jgi:lysophospholipase L1-like esterase
MKFAERIFSLMRRRTIYFLWLALALFPAAQAQAQNTLYFPLISRYLVPTITVSGGVFTYNAAAHAATATATDPGGGTVEGSFTITYTPPGNATPPVNAGVYTVTAQFTSSDPRYGNGTGTGSITINPATPTIPVSGGSFVYDHAAHAATAAAQGVGGVAVPGSIVFTYNPPGNATPPFNAGNYDVTAQFTSSDPNYANAVGSGWLTIRPLYFLAFGDSITYGYTDYTYYYDFPNRGYPRRVYEGLGGGGNIAFYNSGVNSESTDGGLSRFWGSITSPDPGLLYPPEAANIPPDLVLLMEGTNDLDHGEDGFGIYLRLRDMVYQAQQAGKRVVIATITPVFFPVADWEAFEWRIEQFNHYIFEIGSEFGIPVADVFSRFYGSTYWSNDGKHPNPAGFDQMGDVFLQAIQQLNLLY